MKRTIASTLPFLALLIAAGRASAQPISDQVPLDAAKQRYLRAEQRAMEFLQKTLKISQEGQVVEPQELREKIRPLVDESFEARQRLQRAELEGLRRRLADIEQTIESREKNKEAIVNSRIEEVLSGKLPAGLVSIEIGDDAGLPEKRQPPAGRLIRRAGVDVASPKLDERREAPDFDLETRQRLAELDLQAAEEEYVAAEKDLSRARKLYETAAVTYSVVEAREKDHRHASVELKRAKAKLEGLARQRADLEAKADAAIAEASAEQNNAAAKVATCEADYEAARARVESAQGNVAAAAATCEYRTKHYQRSKKLVDEKAVEEKVLDEEAERLAAAKAGLDAAKSAVLLARANMEQSKSMIEQARAELKVADARLRAAEAQRDRLLRHGQTSETTPTKQENIPGGAAPQ